MSSTSPIILSVGNADHVKRLRDPANPDNLYHLEAYLSFTEAAKLAPGNANVRPPRERKPTKSMIATVEDTPELFHLKNRGITYVCPRFEFDNSKKTITIHIPHISKQSHDDDDAPRFG